MVICFIINAMEEYKKRFALTLSETGAIFFDRDLVLKDGRPTPYFVNMAMFRTSRLSIDLGSFFAGMMISEGLVKDTDIIWGLLIKGAPLPSQLPLPCGRSTGLI